VASQPVADLGRGLIELVAAQVDRRLPQPVPGLLKGAAGIVGQFGELAYQRRTD
jgi:hypothetical protein